MTADPRRRPFRNVQRRIRRRQAMTGETYTAAAAAVEAEWERGQRYLSDPSVPADVAAVIGDAGFIPLEPLNPTPHWDWWCRCRWCGEVAAVSPHAYSPDNHRFFKEASKHVGGRCVGRCPDPAGVERGQVCEVPPSGGLPYRSLPLLPRPRDGADGVFPAGPDTC